MSEQDPAALVARAKKLADWLRKMDDVSDDAALLDDLASALEAALAREENADRRLKWALAAAWPTCVRELLAATDDLSFHAQTTGGTAGRDGALVTAIDRYAKAREVAEEKYRALARAALAADAKEEDKG